MERDFSRFFARSSNKGPRSSSTGRDDLTPFSRECACLWRQLYGARSGHYNNNPAATRAAAAKATARRGPLRRATVGVLGAARLAAQCKRARLPTSAAAVAPGAGTDRRPQWTEKMQEFHNRSRRNIPGVTQVRAAPGGAFLKPPGVDLAPSRAARGPPKEETCPHRMVAVLTTTASGVERCLRGKGCRFLTGPHRCAEANLVVAVPDLAILHDSRALAADVDLAVSFLYVVAFGIDVVKETQLAAASYFPGRFFFSVDLWTERLASST